MPRIPEELLERIKTEVPLVALIERRGVVLRVSGDNLLGLCPFHDDHEPSLAVTAGKGLWHCLGACQTGGTAIDWVMKAEGVSFRRAVEILLAEFFPMEASRLARPKTGKKPAVTKPAAEVLAPTNPAASSPNPSAARVCPSPVTFDADLEEVKRQVVDYYHETLKESPEALEYLKKRGLGHPELVSHFKLGFANRSLGVRLPLANRKAGSEIRTKLQEAGIYRESGHEHLVGCLTVPVFDENGNVTEIYGRRIEENLKAGVPKHLYLPGPHRGVFNVEALKSAREVILCEALIDALTFWCAGFRNVTASYGVEGFTADHMEAFRRHGVERVLIAYDRDEAGDRAAEALAKKLLAEGITCSRILFPKGMDANEYARKVQPAPASLGVLVRSAERMGAAAPTQPALTAKTKVPKTRIAIRAPKPATAAREANAPPAAAIEGTLDPLPSLAALKAGPASEDSPAEARESESLSSPADVSQPGPVPSAAKEEMADGRSSPATVTETASLAVPPALPPAIQTPGPLPASSPPPTEPSIPLETLLADVFEMTCGERFWSVTWTGVPSPAHLKATVCLRIGASLDAGGFIDSLDLLSARARASFAKRAASDPSQVWITEASAPHDGTPPGESTAALRRALEADLLRITTIGQQRRKALESPAAAIPMTEFDGTKALRFLRSPDLLEQTAGHITLAGYVGEPTNKRLGYLVGISRKLDVPLSMVILSPSGSGKSGLADALEAMTPEEDFISLSSISAQALYYMPKDKLQRKFILIEERAGSLDADYSIRALQSKKKLTRAVPIKDPSTGKIETKIFEILGPAAFLETTTESHINIENATRCFEIHLDESQEQTERIQRAQRHAKTFEGLWEKERREEVIRLHHNAQRLLRTIPVVIPFADEIEFPTAWLRTRRDNLRFLHLIEVLAFFRQYQRPLVERRTVTPLARRLEDLSEEELKEAVVIATLEDYASAYELAGGLLGDTLQDLKRPEREFLAAIREHVDHGVKENPGRDFSRRETREWTGLPQHRVRQLFDALLELEYVEPVRNSRGTGVRYRLTSSAQPAGPSIPGLLTPGELKTKLDGLARERRGKQQKATGPA